MRSTHNDAVAALATYEEITNLPQNPHKMLVDVRMPEELANTGVIPTSINVPLNEVSDVFSASMSSANFETRFGRAKPDQHTPLIFMCMSGSRSETAAQIAIGLSYKSVKNYRGSWQDWALRNELHKK